MTDNKDLNQSFDKLEARLESLVSAPDPSIPLPDSCIAAASNSHEIDLSGLFVALWRGRYWIVASVALFSLLSLTYALSLPNVYRSTVLLAPVSQKASAGGLAALAGQYGALAGLSGVGGEDKTALALAVLESRSFLFDFIEKNDLDVPLMAASGWSRESGNLIIDPEVYDRESQAWVRKVKPPKRPAPSRLEVVSAFKNILTVSQDRKSGFVMVSIDFVSPSLAKDVVGKLVQELNHTIKSREINQSEKAVKYLKSQLDSTSIAEMHAVFYGLIQEQIKTVMLAHTKEDYVFSVIDKPVVPELKFSPNRKAILVLGFLVGGFFGVVGVVFVAFRKQVMQALS